MQNLSSPQFRRTTPMDDPAFGTVKTLDVEYTLNGKRLRLTGTDPETADFVTGPAPPYATAQVRSGAEGRLWLEAREPGANTVAKDHEFWADDVPFAEAVGFAGVRLLGHQQVTDAYLLGLAIRRRRPARSRRCLCPERAGGDYEVPLTPASKKGGG